MSLQRKLLLAFLLGIPVLAVGVIWAVQSMGGAGSSETEGSYKEITWSDLRSLNIETGEKPPELASLDGARVKLPGFIVPLDDNTDTYSEFLLVPSPQACIHVPAPPANQMVLVRMVEGHGPKRTWRPTWLKGRLQISTNDSAYGKTSYRLNAEGWEEYKVEF